MMFKVIGFALNGVMSPAQRRLNNLLSGDKFKDRTVHISDVWRQGYPVFLLEAQEVFIEMKAGQEYYLLKENNRENYAVAPVDLLQPSPDLQVIGRLKRLKDCLLLDNDQLRGLVSRLFHGINIIDQPREAHQAPNVSRLIRDDRFFVTNVPPVRPQPEHLEYEHLESYSQRRGHPPPPEYYAYCDAHVSFLFVGREASPDYLEEAAFYFPPPRLGGFEADLEAAPGCHNAVNEFTPFFQQQYGHRIYRAAISYHYIKRVVYVAITGTMGGPDKDSRRLRPADKTAVEFAALKAFRGLLQFDQVICSAEKSLIINLAGAPT